MRAPFHSLTHSRLTLAALAAVSVAVGQVNVTSDVVTFRDSGKKDKTTTHYGMMWLYGQPAPGYYALCVQNQSTSYGTYGTYMLANNCVHGIGGRFDASGRGLMGVALVSGDGPRTGGWFTAGNGGSAHGMYGIYAQTEGSSGVRYAGYFSGNVYCTGSYQGSDAVLKKDARPLQGAVQTLTRLRPQTYFFDTLTYRSMTLPSVRQYGLVAQDVEQILPEIVNEAVAPETSDSTGGVMRTTPAMRFKCVNYTALVPVLVAAIQEQQAQIEAQKNEIETLKQSVAALQAK